MILVTRKETEFGPFGGSPHQFDDAPGKSVSKNNLQSAYVCYFEDVYSFKYLWHATPFTLDVVVVFPDGHIMSIPHPRM